MFRGGANLLFVASESEDDADIPPLVSDSEDGLMFDVIDAVEISFEAQPKRKHWEIIVKNIEKICSLCESRTK